MIYGNLIYVCYFHLHLFTVATYVRANVCVCECVEICSWKVFILSECIAHDEANLSPCRHVAKHCGQVWRNSHSGRRKA